MNILSTPDFTESGCAENEVTPLIFADAHLSAHLVTNVRGFPIARGEPTIVANLGPKPAVLAGPRDPAGPKASRIQPWRSTVLEDTVIVAAESVVLLRVTEEKNLGGLVRSDRWVHTSAVFPGFPSDVPLWRSSQQEVGSVRIDPVAFATQGACAGSPADFRVKVNLWFSPEHTDCQIHNKHTFLEVHTQVYGVGRMQKFHRPEESTRLEDVILSPGATHDPFMEIAGDGTFIYPWHRYYSDTDCIWMAIELHPVPVA